MRTFCVTKYLCYLGGNIVFKCAEFSEDKMVSSILKIDLFPSTLKKNKWKVQ